MQRGRTTLRIQRRPPRRRNPFAIWAARLGLTLGLLLVVGTAGIFGAAWYGETLALEKIDELGKRAGLDVRVGTVVLQPGSFVALLDVEVRDPEDDRLLMSARRITTDLTLSALRAGRRRPRQLLFDGLHVDLSAPDRWRAAYRRYRGDNTEEAGGGPKRALPEVAFVDSSFVLPDLGQTHVDLVDVRGHAIPEARADGRWSVSVVGRTPGGPAFDVDAWLDRQGDNHEIGATFEPALEVRRRDMAVAVSGITVLGRRAIRVANLALETSSGSTLSARYAEIRLDDDQPLGDAVLPDGPAVIDVRDVKASHRGLTTDIAVLRTRLSAGTLDRSSGAEQLVAQVAARVTSVGLDGLAASWPRYDLSVQANRLAVDTREAPQDAPLERIATVRIEGSDTRVALPSAETMAALPYYREVQALLSRSNEQDGPPAPDDLEPAARGGGPALVPVPGTSKHRALLSKLPKLQIEDSTLSLTIPGEQDPAFLIGGLEVSLAPAKGDTAALTGAVSGRVQEVATGEQGTFALAATATPDGAVESARIQLSGRKLAQLAARLDDHIRVSEASWLSVDARLTPHARGRGVTAAGSVSVRNVGFEARRIHGTPVDGIAVDADWTLDLYPDEKKIVLDAPSVRLMESGIVRLAATLEQLDQRLPKIDLKIEVPKQDCAHLVASIPPAMVPRLDGLRLGGVMKANLSVSVDLMKPRTYTHDLDIDLSRCRPTQYGRADVSKLNRRFVHEVVEKGDRIGVTVGPGTWHYRALRRIPEHVQMGALATEDHSFFKHEGFRPSLIRRAVVMNLEGGRYVYGGSTITQQLVKNLFLSREKTLTRKLEEAIIVWMVESAVSKKRILELYLNCIEYGPKLYGLENAARAYFGKHVEELNALEGAFLMGLKPYPWAGWRQFERGYVKPWWHRRLKKILTGMARSGWITQEQLDASRSWEPIFLTSKRRVVTPPPEESAPEAEPPAPAPEPEPAGEAAAVPTPAAAPLRERVDAPVGGNLDPDEPPAMPNDAADDRPGQLQ